MDEFGHGMKLIHGKVGLVGINNGGEGMTKIEEFEKRMIKEGLTEDDYDEYDKLLKRVRGNFLRLQHCYKTAVQFPQKRYEQAIRLIEWGLEKYPDTWFSTYSAYYDIGVIYECCGKYEPAFEAYQKAADVLGDDKTSYQQTISGNLLWMLLHIEGFMYTEQIEKYYDLFNGIDDFERAFINNDFRLAVAEVVIFSHKALKDKAAASYERAIKLCKPNAVSRIQGILDKHKAKDKLRNTPECAAFLKTVKV